MKIVTKKNISLVLQFLTIVGILVSLGAGVCLLGEIADIYFRDGIPFHRLPAEQLPTLYDELPELLEDGAECGLVAGLSLLVSLVSGVAAFVLTCCIKPEVKQA